jgi:hypothetical protein
MRFVVNKRVFWAGVAFAFSGLIVSSVLVAQTPPRVTGAAAVAADPQAAPQKGRPRDRATAAANGATGNAGNRAKWAHTVRMLNKARQEADGNPLLLIQQAWKIKVAAARASVGLSR